MRFNDYTSTFVRMKNGLKISMKSQLLLNLLSRVQCSGDAAKSLPLGRLGLRETIRLKIGEVLKF